MIWRSLLVLTLISGCSPGPEKAAPPAEPPVADAKAEVNAGADLPLLGAAQAELEQQHPGVVLISHNVADTGKAICGRIRLLDGAVAPFQYTRGGDVAVLKVPLGVRDGRVTGWRHVERDAEWMADNCRGLGAPLARPVLSLPHKD